MFFSFEARSCWQTAVLVGVNVLDRLGQQCHSSEAPMPVDNSDGIGMFGKVKDTEVEKVFRMNHSI